MARVILTMLLLTCSLGLLSLTSIEANATLQSPVQSEPGACREPLPDADDDGMEYAPGLVRVEGPQDTPGPPESEYYHRRSVICFPAGASVPDARHDFTYHLYVSKGELTIVVSEIGSTEVPEGQALLYRDNIFQAVPTDAPVTLSLGDAIFLANVSVSFENPTAESTEIIAIGVIKDPSGPNCPSRCWLP